MYQTKNEWRGKNKLKKINKQKRWTIENRRRNLLGRERRRKECWGGREKLVKLV